MVIKRTKYNFDWYNYIIDRKQNNSWRKSNILERHFSFSDLLCISTATTISQALNSYSYHIIAFILLDSIFFQITKHQILTNKNICREVGLCSNISTEQSVFFSCNTSLKVKKYQILNFLIAPLYNNTPFCIQNVLQKCKYFSCSKSHQQA